MSIKDLANSIKKNDTRALAKAFSLLETEGSVANQKLNELLSYIRPLSNQTLNLGITGSPGAGKSTFIEALGMYFSKKGLSIAVLTIDPSSSISGGSLLGDQTRMAELSNQPNTFIRPIPSGVENHIPPYLYEALQICNHAEFDIIFIETVGLGQSDIELFDYCDLSLYISSPLQGDDIQDNKKGIMELVDYNVMTKTDLHNTSTPISLSLHNTGIKHFQCSSITREGIPEIGDEILTRKDQIPTYEKRSNQLNQILRRKINYLVLKKLSKNLSKEELTQQVNTMKKNNKTLEEAAHELLNLQLLRILKNDQSKS